MKKSWNRYLYFPVQEEGSSFEETSVHEGGLGLDQELNQTIGNEGELVVPELIPAARAMAAEGIVLLKNQKATLPVKAEETLAVFGRTAVDYFTVGYGSGGDVVAPYKLGLMEGLREAKVRINEELAAVYEDWCHRPENIPDQGTWGNWPMSYPEMALTTELVMETAKTSDLALVVIGRAAGEDRENLLEKGSYYLTDDERAMLDLVTDYFERVCVVMDCGNIIDMGWTADYGDKLTAILYAWQGGMESGRALTDVLTGAVNPSARLTDTIVKNYEMYPGSEHFGAQAYNNYVEDIYVGYRYFETFHPEQVIYPFGFGLSYTRFSMETASERDGNRITLRITVTNTGSAAGKQVVQAYLGLPEGKLGNPAKVLAAFGKTQQLAPGECETLELAVDLAQFAPYDDGGATGHRSAFVLEPGTYRVFVGDNVRDAEPVLAVEKTELEVVAQMQETLAVKPGTGFRRMVNRGGNLFFEEVPTALKNLREEILNELPKELIPAEKKEVSFFDVKSGRNSAEEFVAQLTPEELDEISHGYGPMNCPFGTDGNAGCFGGVTEKLRNRGLPAMTTTDGPSGIRLFTTTGLLPCGTALASSFNEKGVEELYALVSREMEILDSHMLLAPGMNIHRDPLCGRNFEYYSEDPFLTGKMAAAAVRGIQYTGRSACPKHFACNNQESYRNVSDSRVSERALREIYLRGFEIAVKESNPMAIMTSYNKINGVWSHYHYELVTQILRRDWGFDGLVITDWWMQPDVSKEFENIRDDAYRIRAQVDVLMPGDFGDPTDSDARALVPSLNSPAGVSLAEAQRCALNVVNFILKVTKNRG